MTRCIFLIMAFVLISCSDRDPEIDLSYIVFGSFHGECVGEQCVEIFKIKNRSLMEDSLDIYPSSQLLYSGSFIPLPDQSYQTVKDIFEVIPNGLASENDTVIGSPDAADQGGFYLELIVDGNNRFWLIDTDKQSVNVYLHELMDSLDSKIKQLR